MGVNEIDFANLSAAKGLNSGLALGAQLGGMYRDNRIQDNELAQKENQRIIDDAARDAYAALQISDPEERDRYLAGREKWLIDNNKDPSHTRELRSKPFGEQTNELKYVLSRAMDASSLVKGMSGAGSGIQSTDIDPVTGMATIVYKDGSVESKPVDGLEGRGEKVLDDKQRAANIEIDTASKIDKQRLVANALADRKKEYGTMITQANREIRRINEALALSEKADSGLTAQAKVKFSSVFGGIDVSDESALDSALTGLAVEQLAAFKGPTTDFEFGKIEDITGRMGQSREARNAKLNVLKRANWFKREEYNQFKAHAESGGDPDFFEFDFSKETKTKKGAFTLQQLQDTAAANNISIEDVLKRLNQ